MENLQKQGRSAAVGADSDDDDEYGPTDEALTAQEQDDNAASSAALDAPSSAALKLCKAMQQLAEAQRHQPDAKVQALLSFVREHMCSGACLSNIKGKQREWLPRRLIIFTEYGDTKRYLLEQLRAALERTDRAEERILQIYGGMNDEHRAEVQRAFCGDYQEFPVRILVATDAAREGLNLQTRCADLFHFDIPWNPGRMEQRNGRIDRVLQKSPEVRCHYFSYDDRPEDRVLQVLVRKVETIGTELGSLGEVVLQRMGDALKDGITSASASAVDAAEEVGPQKQTVQMELGSQQERDQEMAAEIKTAKDLLNKARDVLNFTPEALRKTLATTLKLMRLEPLEAVKGLEGGVARYKLPDFPGAWQETLDSLRPPRQRGQDFYEWRRLEPQLVSFEPDADPEDGVAPLHLSHPLVRRLLARFGTQGFGTHDLSRVTVVSNPSDSHARVIALGRLSLFGAGAARLHDRLVWVSVARSPKGRGPADLQSTEDDKDKEALPHFWELMQRERRRAVPAAAQQQVLQWAPDDFAALWPAVQERAQAAEQKARRALQARGEDEAEAMRSLLISQMKYLAGQLQKRATPAFSEGEKTQRQQFELDTKAMTKRQESLAKELETEPADIARQYRVELRRLEPVGLIYLLPE